MGVSAATLRYWRDQRLASIKPSADGRTPREMTEEIKEAILRSLPTTDRNGDGAVEIGDLIDVVHEVP